MATNRFRLQFPPSKIDGLAARYDYPSDTNLRDAGRRIAGGTFTFADLEVIYRWKTRGRGISRLCRNTTAEIVRALRLALQARSEREAVEALIELSGVGVPVASAILTAINPHRYTIIDYRALEALGIHLSTRSAGLYLEYLAACRSIAAKHHVTLRKLDRAMWQWSRERSAAKRTHVRTKAIRETFARRQPR